jgi:hypothetical protein
MLSSLKFPLLIISSPRTGSTALGNSLSRQTGVKFFPIRVMERTIECAEMESRQLMNYIKNSTEYIVKVHSHQYDLINQVIKLTPENMTLCRIRRRNLVDQIAGLYIANMRRTWTYFNQTQEYNRLSEINMNIDLEKLNYFSDVILHANEQLDTFDITRDLIFDYDLWYEDLTFEPVTIVTPYPTNYQDIKNEVTNILKGK